MVRQPQHLGVGVGRRDGQGAAAQQGQVGPVVAHGGGFVPAQAQFSQEGFGGRPLVFVAEPQMRHTQRLQARAQGRRVAPAHHRHHDAGALQQFDAVAVEAVKALEGLARFAKVQAGVGEHAVDVEKHHPYALGAQQQGRVETERWEQGGQGGQGGRARGR